jgi:hypothetical protein
VNWYVDETNAAVFGKKLINAARKLRLIILSSCNLGCFAHNLDSVVQIVADTTGVPVMSAQGYVPGSLRTGSASVLEEEDGLTYQGHLLKPYKVAVAELRAHPNDAKVIAEWSRWWLLLERSKGHDSKAGACCITYPWWWNANEKAHWKNFGEVSTRRPTPAQQRAHDLKVKKQQEAQEEKKKKDMEKAKNGEPTQTSPTYDHY